MRSAGSLSLAEPVDNNGRTASALFRPVPLIGGAHLQTLVAMFWPGVPERYPSLHEPVDLGDGDQLMVVTSTPAGWRPGLRTVVLVHGLCGCYGSPYMRRIAGKLYRRGIRAVRVNLRGCGSGAGLARLPYHSGRSEDIRRVLQWLAGTGRAGPVTLVGFSLGGNIVLKLGGEDGGCATGGLDSLVAVSPPIDLAACSRLIELPRNRAYESYFVRRLLQDVRRRQQEFPDLPPLRLPARVSLRVFDDCYTAPRCGFRGALDYYGRASAAPLVERIAVPTLIVASRDDPVVAAPPLERIPRREPIELCLTDRGGHLGFLGFTDRMASFRWMDRVVLDWIVRQGGAGPAAGGGPRSDAARSGPA